MYRTQHFFFFHQAIVRTFAIRRESSQHTRFNRWTKISSQRTYTLPSTAAFFCFLSKGTFHPHLPERSSVSNFHKMPRGKFREKEKEDTQGRNSSGDYTHAFVTLGKNCITIRLRHFCEQQTKCAE